MTDDATSTNPPAAPAPPAPGGTTVHRRLLRSRLGWLRPAFWLLLTGGVVFLAVRSFKHSDFLALFTRAGNAQGFLSHRGRVLVAFSDVSFGPERSLTADAGTLPTEKGEELYTLVYKDWPRRHERLGFGFAASNKGDLALDGKPTVVAAVAPHWFVAVLTFLPFLLWVRKAVRRRRRVKRGLCLYCGYPLPDPAGACPECGRLPDGTRADAAAADGAARRGPAAARTTAVMLLALLLLGGVAAAAPLVLKPPGAGAGAAAELTPAEAAAGLGRRVADFRVDHASAADALDTLARQSGTRIVLARDESPWDDERPVTVRLRDVTVAVAVRTVMRATDPGPWVGDRRSGLGGPRFAVTAAGGVITVSRPPPEPEFVARAYDVRDIVDAPGAPFGPPPPGGMIGQSGYQDVSAVVNGTAAPFFGDKPGSVLIGVVETFISPDGWDGGGPITSTWYSWPVFPPTPATAPAVTRTARLWYGDGRLVVVQTADNQRRVEALLDQVRAAGHDPARAASAGATAGR